MSAINQMHMQQYLYDFAVDGGLVSTIDLSAKANHDPLPVGAVVSGVSVYAETAVTSGGAPTIDIGNGDDVDGYIDGMTPALLAVDLVVTSGALPGVLLWDDTNDHEIHLFIDDATTGKVQLTIVTAALTAGKLWVTVFFYMPTK